MNYAIVFKLLAMIFGILFVSMSVCLGVCLWFSDMILEQEALHSWIACVAVALLICAIFYMPSRRASPKLFRREAMCIIGVGWILSSIFGALPFILIADCNFIDAFFESASGFTTTGASVFADVSSLSNSLIFWRCLTQWIGGLGVVVFFVVILSFVGAGARILYSNEATVDSLEHDSGRIKNSVIKIFYIYIGLSLVCLLSFWICGMDFFNALCHMCTTVSTGGFELRNSGIASYDSAMLEWITVLFMFLGGTSFVLILRFLNGNFQYIKRNTEFKFYCGILLFTILVVALSLVDFQNFDSWHKSFRMATFQCVSIMTTTGFVIADYDTWLPLASIILFMLMVVGGCSGSTSGGLKVFRVAAALKLVYHNIEKSFRTKLVRSTLLNGKALTESTSLSILIFITLYVLIFFAGVIVVSIFDNEMSFAGTMSAVIASLSNIGVGLAEVGAYADYSHLSDVSKFTLGFLMIIGRIELYAILVLFVPSFWRSFR